MCCGGASGDNAARDGVLCLLKTRTDLSAQRYPTQIERPMCSILSSGSGHNPGCDGAGQQDQTVVQLFPNVPLFRGRPLLYPTGKAV